MGTLHWIIDDKNAIFDWYTVKVVLYYAYYIGYYYVQELYFFFDHCDLVLTANRVCRPSCLSLYILGVYMYGVFTTTACELQFNGLSATKTTIERTNEWMNSISLNDKSNKINI